MNINLREKQYAPTRKEFINHAPSDNQYGFWGIVTEVHPEDCTVHVRTNLGFVISGVRVASLEWVTVEDGKHLTGERKLPPIDTYVFCIMPNGEYSSAFVLCSGFARHDSIHSDFKNKSDDTAKTQERVENSGWKYTSDYRTGTKIYQNKVDNPTITIEINQESDSDEKIIITAHGTEINITKDDGIKIKTDKKIDVANDDTVDVKSGGAITVKAEKTDTLEVGNSIATLGAMISELLDNLIQLKTFGSPALHSVMPDSVTKLTTLKTKWEQVFK